MENVTRSLAFLLIFGIGGKPELLDRSQGVKLVSRLHCDGVTAPEDQLRVHATFSAGGAERKFEVSRSLEAECPTNVEFGCIWKNKPGWRPVWSATNGQPTTNDVVPIASCYKWGSKEPADYVLTAWYKDGTGKKAEWKQVAVKQTSETPQVLEFSDPSGGSGRIEIRR
jgi:hypothetical protein